MTFGWWKIDSVSSQLASFNVTSPPLTLPVSAVIWSKNSVPVVVTVKVTHSVSGTRACSKNTSGSPNPVRPWVRRRHSAKETRCVAVVAPRSSIVGL
jgi:hypothetical protein